MMRTRRRMSGFKKLVAISTLGTAFAFPWGACNLGEFQTTSTVTLSGREVVSFLVQSAILTPIETVVNRGVDALFDKLENDED